MRAFFKMMFGGAVLSLALFSVQAQEESESGDDVPEAAGLEEVLVVGSRHVGREEIDSPVPIAVVSSDQLGDDADVDLDQLLSSLVPAYNVRQEPISDAATFMRPANLRSLSADATLVLLNYKRRHRGAVITFLGGGMNEGAQGVDLGSIPAIALERVEVLRDGASAQYGSDAIAGVINVVLREDDDIRRVQLKTGQYYEGDGQRTYLAGIFGMPLEGNGFLTLSGETGVAEPTVRSVQRDDALALIRAGNDSVRTPYAQIWGAPETKTDYKLFGNLGMEISSTSEFYGWANYSFRDVEGGFFFRNPTTRGGVFTGDGGATILVADLEGEIGDCPVVAVVNNAPDPAALAAVSADPGCYALNSRFPGGFTPQFGAEITDQSFGVGFRGEMLWDWDYDASLVWGYSGAEFYIYNTINPQLIDQQDNIPTFYNPGIYEETDTVINFDMSRSVDVDSGAGPVYVAVGAEYRNENFTITAGEENSWVINERFAEQGFGIGSNGFPGFPPSAETDSDRQSWSLWFDAEQDLTSNMLGSLAVRYENYETFGTTVDGKISLRLEVTDGFALRSSFSTGFRAPTSGQANVRNVTTSFIISPSCANPTLPCLADEATLPPTDPIAQLKGGKELQPESSQNFSAGIVWYGPMANVEIDYYEIKVEDRLARTSNQLLTPDDIAALLADGHTDATSFTAIKFFTNDFDTETEGIDIVFSRDFELMQGETKVMFAGNWTRTAVVNWNDELVNEQRRRELEESIPLIRFTLSVNHKQSDKISYLVRARYFDEYWEPHLFTDTLPLTGEPNVFLDAEFQYAVNEDLNLTVGLQNILDTYPTENPHSGVAGATYPLNAPAGFNGGYIYTRLSFDF